MTRSRYRIYEDYYPYFLTCTIVGWLPVFTRPEAAQIVFDCWRFLRSNKNLTLYGYVLLENHLHLIADSQDLAKDCTFPKRANVRRPSVTGAGPGSGFSAAGPAQS